MNLEDLERFNKKRYTLLKEVDSGIESTNALAEEQDLSHTSIVRPLRRMEEIGWIEIEQTEKGNQPNNHLLTEKGKEVLETVEKILDQSEENA